MRMPTHIHRHLPSPIRSQGFTAIELLVVVSIVAILAALAGPSFNNLLTRWRVAQTVESIQSTLEVARRRALYFGGLVSVRKIPNNTDGCTTASTNQEWNCGWIVFRDLNDNGAIDAGEEELHRVPIAGNTGITVNNINGSAFFRIDRFGQPNNLGAASFNVVPPDGVSSPNATVICMAAGGRIRTQKGSVTC